MDEETPIDLEAENTYYQHKFCYICGSTKKVRVVRLKDIITFHHFNNIPRFGPELPPGVLKKDGEEGIPLCRKHHDMVEEIKGTISYYKGRMKDKKKQIIKDVDNEALFLQNLSVAIFEDFKTIKNFDGKSEINLNSEKLINERIDELTERKDRLRDKILTRKKISRELEEQGLNANAGTGDENYFYR